MWLRQCFTFSATVCHLRFSVTLRKSVYKDPSLHFFDVRRLYQVLGSEGLIDAVLALDTSDVSAASRNDDSPSQAVDDGGESIVVGGSPAEALSKDVIEQRQMSLLGNWDTGLHPLCVSLSTHAF